MKMLVNKNFSDISNYPYNAFDMSEFKGGTIIPLGSDIVECNKISGKC